MPDAFGAVPVPLVPPAQGDAVGDPALSAMLAFFKAFLVADQNVTALWNASGVAPGAPPVIGTFPFDPMDATHVFNENTLPALFMWRDSSTDEQAGEDWEVETTQCKLLWVFPVAAQIVQTARAPFVNAMAKAIKVAVNRARTPGYVMPGDTDRLAATQGSIFHTPAGLLYASVSRHKTARVAVEMVTAPGQRPTPPRSYRGLEVTIEIKELLTYGLDRFATISATNGTYVSLYNAAGELANAGPL